MDVLVGPLVATKNAFSAVTFPRSFLLKGVRVTRALSLFTRFAVPSFAQSCRKVVCRPVADERLDPGQELSLLRREANHLRASLRVGG